MQFKLYRAEGILKRFLKSEPIDPDMLDVAMTVCRRNLLELDDIIDNPYKTLVSESEWLILKKGEKKKGLKSKKDKKISSLVPVRRNKIHQSPTGTLKNLNSKKENTYKSPSIVTLKLPEIENKPMYNTVKENGGFFIDHQVKEEVMNSLYQNQEVKEGSDTAVLSDRNIASTGSSKRPMSNPQANLLRDVKNICERLDK